MKNIKILTHRGLDPSRPGYFGESSLEAFRDQLARGYGLEFDIQFTQDEVMIAVHDATLKRITAGRDKRKFNEVRAEEILGMEFDNSHFTTLPQLLTLIARTQSPEALSALHFKATWQEPRLLSPLLHEIKKSAITRDQFIIFDVKPDTAKFIKEKMPELVLAASVSHPYDIERYNAVVGGTLISLEEILSFQDLYSWAWLDEWDLVDQGGTRKKLCTEDVFARLRAAGLKIALVTPELHAHSPGLLGGESHEDGTDHKRLLARFRKIIALAPDAICTDYPDEVRALAEKEFFSK